MHQGLYNEVNYIIRKINSAYQKRTLVFEDLIKLKYSPNSNIVKTFIGSNIALLKIIIIICINF